MSGTQTLRDLVGAVEQVLVGKHAEAEQAIIGLAAAGHLLIEDVPGVGKTMLAKSLARATGCTFKRIQFTPDLLPSDVTGVSIYNQRTGEFEFRAGPIVAHVVLADEINRATPKTQSALLEAMEEHQVTVEGVTRPLPSPFMVLATQNPIEDLAPVTSAHELQQLQQAVRGIHVDPQMQRYIVHIVGLTRDHPDVYLGASPRGSLALMRASQARAMLAARDYVIPDDVKALASAALAHRLIMSPEARMRNATAQAVIASVVQEVPVPGSRVPA